MPYPTMLTRLRWLTLWAALVGGGGGVHAEPLVPGHDDEVVETLPAVRGSRADERRLRQQWAAQPNDARLATALAHRYLTQAREQGEPRYAGRALAVLQAWPDAGTAPDEVLLLRATLQQHLHDFDGAQRLLELLVQRQPRHAQGWLTLATIHRVKGRYAQSDAACHALAAMPEARVHAQACLAENQGLRGEFSAARQGLQALLAQPQLPAATQAWLLTTLADIETRAGRPALAEQAYRAALQRDADDYTTLAYADVLLAQRRRSDAVKLLNPLPRTDAVLLRLAWAEVQAAPAGADTGAGAGAGRKTATGPAAEAMRQRLALAHLRPEARRSHAREQALFALQVDRDPVHALALARLNVALQREPVDVLLLAQAARAANQADALREAAALRQQMGLRDARLDALL